MKGIYEFYRDCGRMGDLEGTFIADSEAVANVVGKYIYFGEVLGKHSEIAFTIKPDDIWLKTDNQEFISLFEQIMGEGWSTGYSPLDYLPEEEQEEDEE